MHPCGAQTAISPTCEKCYNPVMTAVGLLDVLARQRGESLHPDPEAADRLGRLAEDLVESSLADLQRLWSYERDFVNTRQMHATEEVELRRSIWQLFRDWADDAKQVRDRTRALEKSAITVEGSNRLEELLGNVEARLSVTPEKIAAAAAQARDGQFIPAKELRDELHARLRA